MEVYVAGAISASRVVLVQIKVADLVLFFNIKKHQVWVEMWLDSVNGCRTLAAPCISSMPSSVLLIASLLPASQVTCVSKDPHALINHKPLCAKYMQEAKCSIQQGTFIESNLALDTTSKGKTSTTPQTRHFPAIQSSCISNFRHHSSSWSRMVKLPSL